MKSKILFIKLLIIFTVSTAFAQTVGNFSNRNYSGAIIYDISSRIHSENSGNIVDLSTVKGSPYENDNFLLGKAEDILVGKPRTYYIRYNIYNDVIELKENINDTNIIGLIKSLSIYATINNTEYHYEIYSDDNSKTNQGYFILLNKGEHSNLYLKRTKKFKDKVVAKDSYHKDVPATFVDSRSYYISKERVLIPISSKKKEFLKQFPEKENELKEFIKSEKINLKSEEDLIKLFKYYNSLL